jgi:hypothetical protein
MRPTPFPAALPAKGRVDDEQEVMSLGPLRNPWRARRRNYPRGSKPTQMVMSSPPT